jgi:hypothetical protein
MLKVNSRYGSLVVGCVYKVLGEGCDFYVLSVRGKRMYVPKWVALWERASQSEE